MRVHQAVRVVTRENGMTIYGRIWEFDGGIVYVRTPHGSTIRAGRLFVCPISDDVGFAKLREYEDEARKVGRDYNSSTWKRE